MKVLIVGVGSELGVDMPITRSFQSDTERFVAKASY